MLADLENTIEKLQAFSFGQELENIVVTHKDDLKVLQRAQWGEESKDRFGNEITLNGRGYSPYTVTLKQLYGVGLGRVTDRVTNYQTGALYNNLYATVQNGEFELKSNVPYFDELMQREGDANGLDEDYRRIFGEEITLPEIKRIFKEKTGLEIS